MYFTRSTQYLKLSIIILIFSVSSCTTKKNTSITRGYHNLTARFNVYFNGIESLKAGLRKIDKNYKDDYSTILPIFIYTEKQAAQMITPEMDRCIQKSAKLIKTHSITVKPKVDKKKKLSKKEKDFLNKPEYCKWIDDGYLMMGQAHYYKQHYFTAEQTFLLIINKYKKEPIAWDAKFWLAKSKIEDKEYEDAEVLLKEIRKSSKAPKYLLHEVNLAYADMYMKKQEWSGAIKYLEKSIKEEKDKKFKIRLHFILAQIYQMQENYKKAEANYLEVIKKNYNYDMTFNAKINLAEISEKTKSNDGKLKKELLKMLKDEKNYDYLDQIYYALGRMELNSQNISTAIDYFSKAVSARSSNKMVKAKAYKVLADYYAQKDNYRLAGAYYDSTLISINESFPDYEKIHPLINSKAQLMKNLSIIEIEDSLQFVAKLPERERNKLIDKQIQKILAKEKAAMENKNNGTAFDPAFDNQTSNVPSNIKGGKWYFYNPQAVSYGLTNFKQKWGDRELEDLWRLSNKKSNSEIKKEESTKKNNTKSNNKTQKLSNKTREFYLADLPLTPEKLNKSNKKIENALFNAAMIYADEMHDDDKAVELFEKLLKRFPETAMRLDVLQMLYNSSKRKGDYTRADKYKQMIISEFPESINAKILKDPNYLTDLQKQSKKVEVLYEDAFNYYKAKRYRQTIDICENALKEYPSDELVPKFLYLNALSYGEIGNKEKLKKELKVLVQKYPTAEITANAKEILQIIESGKYEENLYVYEPEIKHYYVLVVAKNKVDFNKLKFDYLSFNLDNYDNLNLNVAQIKLDDERDMIVIQTFKNAEAAGNYYAELISKRVLSAYRLIPYNHFIISENNYKKYLKDQNTEKYLKFYMQNYR
ncbi:MAG: tetratricopeptide repeat protein [Bacteroidales bacterium]|nr:tetratricopeptide repeat protein [Bacteroidales bacterium]